jgi:hypothetical protein
MKKYTEEFIESEQRVPDMEEFRNRAVQVISEQQKTIY